MKMKKLLLTIFLFPWRCLLQEVSARHPACFSQLLALGRRRFLGTAVVVAPPKSRHIDILQQLRRGCRRRRHVDYCACQECYCPPAHSRLCDRERLLRCFLRPAIHPRRGQVRLLSPCSVGRHSCRRIPSTVVGFGNSHGTVHGRHFEAMRPSTIPLLIPHCHGLVPHLVVLRCHEHALRGERLARLHSVVRETLLFQLRQVRSPRSRSVRVLRLKSRQTQLRHAVQVEFALVYGRRLPEEFFHLRRHSVGLDVLQRIRRKTGVSGQNGIGIPSLVVRRISDRRNSKAQVTFCSSVHRSRRLIKERVQMIRKDAHLVLARPLAG
mmetsp:Transcript_3507/g.8288  ORF Transcript_3507/g.8288 Transcript_3507/m.8288 type:complete len:324 (-) Transcript_3507:227-1198(-)